MINVKKLILEFAGLAIVCILGLFILLYNLTKTIVSYSVNDNKKKGLK